MTGRIALGILLATSLAEARPHPPGPPPPPPPCRGKGCDPQNITVGGMTIGGVDRKAQLLYFLERANEELERASLERRSFIPKLVLTLDEEKL